MRAAILALALSSPAFGAIEIQPTATGVVIARSGFVGSLEAFEGPTVSARLVHFTTNSSEGPITNTYEERGIVEFDLSGESFSSEPVYFRFYLDGTGTVDLFWHHGSEPGMIDAGDFISVSDDSLVTRFSATEHESALDFVPYNIDVTQLFNAKVQGLGGDFLGFIFTTQLNGDYDVPALGSTQFGEGRISVPLPGARTLSTSLLGPVEFEFPLPEPSSWLIWLATVAAVAIGYSCSRRHYARWAA